MEMYFWVIYMVFIFMLLIFCFMIYYIMVTVGFKNIRMYYKAYSGRKKGLILVRIYQKIGYCIYALAEKKGSDVVFVSGIDKDKTASYLLDPEQLYRNEMGLNCIDYFEDDIDPRSWKNKANYTISPYAFNNIVGNVVKSEVESKPFDDWFKKYGKMVGIGILILIGILVFVIMQQNDQIVELSIRLAGTKSVVA